MRKVFWISRDRYEDAEVPYAISCKKMKLKNSGIYSVDTSSQIFYRDEFENVFGLHLNPGDQVQAKLSLIKPKRRKKV